MAALLSGVLYALLFPKFNLSFLAPIFAVPFLIYLKNYSSAGASRRGAFFYGLAAGTFSYMIILYWIYDVLFRNGAGYGASVAGWGFLSLYLGIYWGLFALSAVYIFRLDLSYKPFLIAALWTLLEYLKAHLFTGFPWLLAGYSVSGNLHFIQAASITGVYGISFMIIYFNAGLAFALFSKKLKPLLAPSVVIALSWFYGYMVLNAPEVSPEDREKTDITILQGNISQYRKWDDAYEKEILDTYKRLYKKAAAEEPDIIIWPETSLPAALNTNPQMKSYIKKLSETGTGSAYNLIGAVENSRGRYYNSAYLVKPTGDILTPYRKLHLVPFGEFIPFRKFLSPFISVVNETGDFSSGDSYRLLKAGKVKIATGICFEDVFPRLTGKFISKGANVYVNITNDGWYLKSAGAYQHFAHSVFRAVENRIYVIRAANTGISAIISPCGRIEKKTEILTEDTLSKTVSLRKKDTVYTRFGDLFIYLLAILVAVILWKDRKCLKNIKKKLSSWQES